MISFSGSVKNHEFEYAYMDLVGFVLRNGKIRTVRNGIAKSIFVSSLTITDTEANILPLLVGRKMYPKGILGELAAMLRGPKTIEDFEFFGCNYWRQWADAEGNITLDYGNKWIDFNGVNQLLDVAKGLVEDPHGRRHLISAWDPASLPYLSLPCCHYAYQWYVRESEGKQYLDMLWNQRSADLMVGVPSDIVLAVLFNALMANTTGMAPGNVTLVLGDTHIYGEHIENARHYLFAAMEKLSGAKNMSSKLDSKATVFNFWPIDVTITGYEPIEKIDFVLKS